MRHSTKSRRIIVSAAFLHQRAAQSYTSRLACAAVHDKVLIEMTSRAPLPTASSCLFLDVDGTLIEFAAHPSQAVAPRALKDLLMMLDEALEGAVALISGRPIADLDAIFFPLRLRAAGVHGGERRLQQLNSFLGVGAVVGGVQVARQADSVPSRHALRAALVPGGEGPGIVAVGAIHAQRLGHMHHQAVGPFRLLDRTPATGWQRRR